MSCEAEKFNIKCDNLDNPNQVEYKSSDFSIDYLLNHAGSDRCRSLNECDSCPKPSDVNKEPTLNWLHYTRYHPPKIQSKYLNLFSYVF